MTHLVLFLFVLIYLKINKYRWKVCNKKESQIFLRNEIHKFVCFSQMIFIQYFPNYYFFCPTNIILYMQILSLKLDIICFSITFNSAFWQMQHILSTIIASSFFDDRNSQINCFKFSLYSTLYEREAKN